MTAELASLLRATPDLTPCQRAVLLGIAARVQADGRLRYRHATDQELAEWASERDGHDWSLSAVRRAKRALVERGLLVVLRQGTGRTRSDYRVADPTAAAGVQEVLPAVDVAPVQLVDNSAEGRRDAYPGWASRLPRVGVTPTPYAGARESPTGSKGPTGCSPQPLDDVEGLPGTKICLAHATLGRPGGNCRACGTSPRARRQAVLTASRAERREHERAIVAGHEPITAAELDQVLGAASSTPAGERVLARRRARLSSPPARPPPDQPRVDQRGRNAVAGTGDLPRSTAPQPTTERTRCPS